MKYIQRTIFIFLLFTMCSCTERLAPDHNKEDIDSQGERIIKIVFYLPGDDISTPEYQSISNKIIASIKSQVAGEVIGSGFGMGNMEIIVKVTGSEHIKNIRKIIIDNYPNANYSIKPFYGIGTKG